MQPQLDIQIHSLQVGSVVTYQRTIFQDSVAAIALDLITDSSPLVARRGFQDISYNNDKENFSLPSPYVQVNSAIYDVIGRRT